MNYYWRQNRHAIPAAALGVKRADLAQVVGVGARRGADHSSRLDLTAGQRLICVAE